MKRGHKPRKSRLIGWLWTVFGLTLLAGMFSLSFWLTNFLYNAINLQPPALLGQVINSILGLILTGLTASGIFRIAHGRGWLPERQVFTPIIQALERIAAGDFSIRLDNEFEDNRIVGELTSSVNKMAAELDQMETMRQEFISNVSHEIQSPLTSIRGFAQALENDGLSLAERHHYLDIIKTESTRLSRITEDLLKLAALESDRVRFDPQPYRLDRQIRRLILACEPQWTEKRLVMDVSLPEVEITADEDLLSQVWLNLIHNSIKFTPPEGQISLKLHRRENIILFSLSDTGMGISQADQAHIFERFYKSDKSRPRTTGGSGLGLSIVKKIVDIHGGAINVESRVNQGTTFTISLPGQVK
jgi:two-component system phosphate regulon sensor histidine kinase PhoR